MNLIKRVLELDEAGIAGPWDIYEECDSTEDEVISRGLHGPGDVPINKGIDFELFTNSDAKLIAEYRSAAPKLARALKLAIETLDVISDWNEDSSQAVAEKTLEKIRKILGDEPDD